MNKMQKGFTVVEAVILIAIVGLVGVIGWKVYDNSRAKDNVATTTTATDEVPTVTSASDLIDAEDYLNKTDIDSELSTSEIDEALEQ